ncbi:hypothetical protein D3C72_2466330 [compost metagenome]
MQIIALGTSHAHFVFLNGSLHFELAFLHQLLQLLGDVRLNAIFDLDNLFDLVAANFLRLLDV